MIASVVEVREAVGGATGTASVWYAVHVKRNSENAVVAHLTRKSIPAFLPLIEVLRRYRNRRAAVLEPLFPGYLFVKTERVEVNPACWDALRWTPGVRLILGMDDTPVPVPGEVVEAIQTRVRDLGFIRQGVQFTPRSPVLIRHGPLAGVEAIFDRPMSRSGRVRVLLRLLGAERYVQVDVADLEPA